MTIFLFVIELQCIFLPCNVILSLFCVSFFQSKCFCLIEMNHVRDDKGWKKIKWNNFRFHSLNQKCLQCYLLSKQPKLKWNKGVSFLFYVGFNSAKVWFKKVSYILIQNCSCNGINIVIYYWLLLAHFDCRIAKGAKTANIG